MGTVHRTLAQLLRTAPASAAGYDAVVAAANNNSVRVLDRLHPRRSGTAVHDAFDLSINCIFGKSAVDLERLSGELAAWPPG